MTPVELASRSLPTLLPSTMVMFVRVLVFMTAGEVATSAFAHDFEPVRGMISKALLEKQTPSVALAVAKGRQLLWSEGFGWADREAKLKATPETAYGVGSVSKPITATAIMILNSKGRLDLDHSVNEYLGKAQVVAKLGNAGDATMRRMLQHTSGLGAYYQTFFADEHESPPPMDQVIQRYGQLFRRPGARFRYSNLGYGVLGRMVELRSAQSLDTFLREELFLPLQMKQTSLGADASLTASRAVRYGRDNKPLPSYQASPAAAADVWSSAMDLVRFGQLHCEVVDTGQGSPILPSATIESMQTSLVPMGKEHYGLGWIISRDMAGRRRVRHGGAGAGVGAELTLIPAEKLVIAVLVNADTSTATDPKILPTRIADAILKVCLPGPTKPLEARAPATVRDSDPLKTFDGFVGSWQGHIETHRGQGRLTCHVKSRQEVEMRLDSGEQVHLRQPAFDGERLTGKFAGRLGTHDAERRPYELELDVALDSGRLCGSATALSVHPTRGEALPYWVELRPNDASKVNN